MIQLRAMFVVCALLITAAFGQPFWGEYKVPAAGGFATIVGINGIATHAAPPVTTLAAPAISTSAGNTLVVSATNYTSGGVNIASIVNTGGGSGSWTACGSPAGADGSHRIETWYRTGITGSATDTVTVTWASTAAYRGVAVAQFSGIDPTSPCDVLSTVAVGASSTTQTTPATPTTTQADAVVIGYYTAWAAPQEVSNGSNGIVIAEETGVEDNMMAYRVVDATGSYTVDVTLGSADQYASRAIVFKAAPL